MAHIKNGLFYKQKRMLKLLLVNISSYFITSYKWGTKVDFVHINETILQHIRNAEVENEKLAKGIQQLKEIGETS